MSLKDALRRVLVKDNLPKVSKAVKELTSTTVLVGFPATTSMRAGDGKATNAMIAYVHDKGSPARNIPQREFMRTGLMDARQRIEGRMKATGRAALAGDVEEVKNGFEACGLLAQNAIRNKMRVGPFAPLSDKTIAARVRRGRTGTVPLNDTGQLTRALTYIVKKG